MRPLLHPTLVNGRSGDPALYIETLFEKRAILFDLGDISNLPPRKIQRLEHVFVSHAHIDHFIGFDRLLRVVVGREKTIRLYGPHGFIEHIQHKLHGYRWNLVDRYVSDLVFLATEIDCSLKIRTACFRLKKAFSQEDTPSSPGIEGVLYSGPIFRVSTAVLKHRTPCLAFAIEEAAHVNVWKNRLAELGLGVGPSMRELSLRTLRSALTVTPGQKVVYVTDAADTRENRAAIIKLAQNADLLFIEAAFAQADAALGDEG